LECFDKTGRKTGIAHENPACFQAGFWLREAEVGFDAVEARTSYGGFGLENFFESPDFYVELLAKGFKPILCGDGKVLDLLFEPIHSAIVTIHPSVVTIKPLVDCLQPLIDYLQPLVDSLQSFVHQIESLIN